ncbi:MAG TPA: hypothetical protein PKH94_02865 [Bacteroidales bacterium]|nr:hypothetical protein [Bacteroidales bacterium]HNS46156.1 hypothetical protein [Bacteroidales bacterium]
MKTRLTLFCAPVLFTVVTLGQPVTCDLTFTAIDSASYVRLDSVSVMNRTQGSETTIYFPDTTLSLEIIPGDLLLVERHWPQHENPDHRTEQQAKMHP